MMLKKSAPPPEDSILASCPLCSQIRYLEGKIRRSKSKFNAYLIKLFYFQLAWTAFNRSVPIACEIIFKIGSETPSTIAIK